MDTKDLESLQSAFRFFIEDILGLLTEKADRSNQHEEAYKSAIDLLLQMRLDAKNNKDWKTSDFIRNELTRLGFDVKDTKEGYEWKLKAE